ncbi:protein-ER retention protein [Blastomyces dermatitidis ER-3]|uniref:Protein-ER retention protein n=1 Tax=Ajellomyces dermatitidis (strain ER-3 / ATCC MYA-2586) TaxID=559297 RepID=A0ABP2F7B5_AJEDR|nr:protein-ER retention protein [Blastomyces dermatitidis ER-3]EEQ91882.2 protein-ER retention protein [Blastomyces dermatitidis ER-3]
MDPDHDVNRNLDQLSRFSLFFPLPYRVAIVLVAGVWGWGLNLHYLSAVKIDVPALIRYPSRSSIHQVPVYRSTYHLATLLSIPLVISILFFWSVTHGSAEHVIAWEIIPQSYLFLFFVLLIFPLHRLSRTGRHRFVVALKRISIGGLAETQDGKFGDIILADVLTSYSKILGDLFVSACMFLSSDASSTGIPNRKCGGQIAVPLLICIPNAIRLRQCLIEFGRVQRGNRSVDGWGGQHLANALKYSSAFPVILLTTLQRNHVPATSSMSAESLHRLWILSALVNSLFTFYWDVAKDWDLTLFSALNHPNDPDHPFGLRRHRYFYANEMYYSAIVIDLILRFTWVSRLSARLDWVNDIEGGVFALMLLEVVRRWIWIFFRVETEWVRNNLGPAPDDILLGEFNGKIDED